MLILIIVAAALLYLAIGVLGAGFVCGYERIFWQTLGHNNSDIMMSVLTILFWPVALIFTWLSIRSLIAERHRDRWPVPSFRQDARWCWPLRKYKPLIDTFK